VGRPLKLKSDCRIGVIDEIKKGTTTRYCCHMISLRNIIKYSNSNLGNLAKVYPELEKYIKKEIQNMLYVYPKS
jgi:hypothetical protein